MKRKILFLLAVCVLVLLIAAVFLAVKKRIITNDSLESGETIVNIVNQEQEGPKPPATSSLQNIEVEHTEDFVEYDVEGNIVAVNGKVYQDSQNSVNHKVTFVQGKGFDVENLVVNQYDSITHDLETISADSLVTLSLIDADTKKEIAKTSDRKQDFYAGTPGGYAINLVVDTKQVGSYDLIVNSLEQKINQEPKQFETTIPDLVLPDSE